MHNQERWSGDSEAGSILRGQAAVSPGIKRAVTALICEALRSGQEVRLHVASASMEPTLRRGDLVAVHPARPEDVAPGDIICFSPKPGVIYVHRLVRREGSMLVTKGDANEQEDNPIPPSALLGVVKQHLDTH